MKRLGLAVFAAGISLASGTFVASCYNPDLSGVQYTCDELNPYCPDGLECIAGSCLPPGTPLPDGGTPLPDGGISGCRSGMGSLVGAAFACPGAFGGMKPAASELCAPGWRLCADATGVDQGACRLLNGFFGAPVNVRRSGTDFSCGYSPQGPFFAGCGRNTRNTVVDLPAAQACGGFEQAIDCAADGEWLCGSNSLDGSSQTSDSDGVLCCR